MIKFGLTFAIAFLIVSSVSLLWPRFTTAPRPFPLDLVQRYVLSTAAGNQVAQVLGVADESSVTPLNPSEVIGGVIGEARKVVENRVSHIILTQAVRQIESQLERLPPEEQDSIKNSICQPAAQTVQ